MIIELHSAGISVPGTPLVSITGQVVSINGRDDSSGPPAHGVRAKIPAAEHRRLVELRDAAWAVLTSVSDSQSLVTAATATQRGRDMRLCVEVDGERREVAWLYPDKLPREVEELFRSVEQYQWEVPRKAFSRSIPGLVRSEAARRLGGAATDWKIVSKTVEEFDAAMSLPHSRPQAMIAIALEGDRITVSNGERLAAFHASASHGRVEFAEEWRQGELPAYGPAVLDVAHDARRSGDLNRAAQVLTVIAADRASESAQQAAIELAEVTALLGDLGGARRLFAQNIGSGSLDVHTLAVCGVAWVEELRELPAGNVPPAPPSLWAELEVHPWFRPVGAPVRGVPAKFARIAEALNTAPATWRLNDGVGGL